MPRSFRRRHSRCRGRRTSVAPCERPRQDRQPHQAGLRDGRDPRNQPGGRRSGRALRQACGPGCTSSGWKVARSARPSNAAAALSSCSRSQRPGFEFDGWTGCSAPFAACRAWSARQRVCSDEERHCGIQGRRRAERHGLADRLRPVRQALSEMRATADDNVGVVAVEFFLGDEYLGTDTTAPLRGRIPFGPFVGRPEAGDGARRRRCGQRCDFAARDDHHRQHGAASPAHRSGARSRHEEPRVRALPSRPTTRAQSRPPAVSTIRTTPRSGPAPRR